MKKTIAIIAVVLLLSVSLLALTACSPAGEYKFVSYKATSGGVSVEYKAGETYMGVTVEADSVTLELKKDGTYTFTSSIPGFSVSNSGTWVKDGKNIKFDDEYTAELKGKTLTLELGNAIFTMKR